MKSIISIIIALLISISCSYGAIEFSDVSNNMWYSETIQFITSGNIEIINGFPDGSFKPNETLTIEQFIKMVMITKGGDIEGSFSDQHWSMPYIKKAYAKEYIDEIYSKEKLRKPISRGLMAEILSKALADETYEYRTKERVQKLILDFKTLPANQREDIIKVYDKGIITGYPDQTFRADASLTRAEGATVIRRMIQKNFREIPKLPEISEEEYIIEVEGIQINTLEDFEDSKYETQKNTMHIDKQMEFILKFLKNLTFYEENGSYYVKGYTPKLPEGYGQKWDIIIALPYGELAYQEENFMTEYRDLRKDFIPGEAFLFPLEHSPEEYLDVRMYLEIMTEKGGDAGQFVVYKDRRFTKFSIEENKLYNYEYLIDWERMFQW